MPIYEFVCTSCNHEFEAIVSSSQVTSVRCPSCQSGQVKKVMSAASVKVGGSTASLAPPPSAGCGRSGFS